MKINYSAILKTDRIRPAGITGGTILTESENDRSRILFSPAFRRLQQHAHVFSMDANAADRSNLSHSLQVSQVGRGIANQIAIHLGATTLGMPHQGAALVNFVETACLMRNIGNPPFGRSGEAAIQKWFADQGSNKMRAACKTYGGREIGASDPRLVNALADFYEFGGHPQGLRVITKLQWNTDPRGLNLTKTSIATYLRYIRMAGQKFAESAEKFSEKAGFFSTEAGLVKNVWSEFGYSAVSPQRFPLTYIVEAADYIVSCLGDLEDAIETRLVQQHEAINNIKDHWLSSYIPIDPDPADDLIAAAFADAVGGKNSAGDEYSYADFRAALIVALADFAARQYVAQHEAVFAGTLDSLLSAASGAGSVLATLKIYCKQHAYSHAAVQRNELAGYTAVYGLLEHFGILLECSAQRFQAALDYSSDQDAQGVPIFIEKKLLSLFPGEYIKAYLHLITQIRNAHGRDEEFEEWNARAHLVVDFLAGMTDGCAAATFQTLSGVHL
jgi:dGTPase